MRALFDTNILLGFSDFEDAMIAVAADAAGMDYIVTRNESDFGVSPIPVLSPQSYLEKLC